MANPSVLIMGEPTRGIDVGSKFEIYVTMGELASQGTGVLFISSEIEELMGVCDRILVMSRGEMLNEFRREEFSQEEYSALSLTPPYHEAGMRRFFCWHNRRFLGGKSPYDSFMPP